MTYTEFIRTNDKNSKSKIESGVIQSIDFPNDTCVIKYKEDCCEITVVDIVRTVIYSGGVLSNPCLLESWQGFAVSG